TRTVRPKSSAVSESFERGQDSFLKEARLLAQVVHPNIVKVRRFFRSLGTAYIAMDFISGRSLGDVLNEDYRSGGYPSLALKQLLVAVLGGLAVLHQQRIIHRDIKPGNIVIEPNGNPILVDFGAARIFDRALAQGMTVIVTPGYAPIEQYSDDGEQGPFTDIYALGALAYRAIAGHPPDAPYKRLGSNSSAPAAAAGAGKYPTALLEAIDWALAVQPQERPQSADALLAKLRAAPDDLPAAPDEPTQILVDATQILDTSRWRDASKGKGAIVGAEPSLKSGRAEATAILEPAQAKRSSVAHAGLASAPGKQGKLVPALAAALLAIAATGAGAYYLVPSLHSGLSPAADQGAAAKASAAAAEATRAAAAQQKADEEAAEAARVEAARQAAAKAEADRQAAANEAEREAAAKAEAERQAAAKAEADRQAAAKAEAERDAAAKAEAARQATAAKAEAGRQAAAKAEAEREAAVKAEAARQAAVTAEAKKPKPRPRETASTSPSDTTRCSTILQDAQLKEQISDDDRSFLREHCH
ncbi:MAG TPA: serine/threonine-protein kinase, partial [Stellaceae bacterium]